MTTWRWDPNVNEWLTRTSNVRLVPPLPELELYDWEDDPELSTPPGTLAQLGYPDGITPDDSPQWERDLDWDEARDAQWEQEDVGS